MPVVADQALISYRWACSCGTDATTVTSTPLGNDDEGEEVVISGGAERVEGEEGDLGRCSEEGEEDPSMLWPFRQKEGDDDGDGRGGASAEGVPSCAPKLKLQSRLYIGRCWNQKGGFGPLLRVSCTSPTPSFLERQLDTF